MKKEITVYANRYNTVITTDINDLIDTAIGSGDIRSIEDWIDSEFEPCELFDLLDDYKTTEEVKAELALNYEMYCLEIIKQLVNEGDDFWSDIIEVEV